MGDYLRTLQASLAALPTQTYPEASTLMTALTNVCQIEFGSYTGSGVAQVKTTSGNPRLVLLIDDTQTTHALNFTGMAAASYRNLQTGAVVAANGITLGTNSFTIGTAAGINTNLDVGFWVALI